MTASGPGGPSADAPHDSLGNDSSPAGFAAGSTADSTVDSAVGGRFGRRGLLAGAVAAAGLITTSRYAAADPTTTQTSTSSSVGTSSTAPAFSAPTYQTTVPGESIEVDRLDRPVAPGIVLTTFDTFGRTGWLRVSVLNADLRVDSVRLDLIARDVSDTWRLSETADAQHAVAAVNGDYFDITETNAAEGPEIKDGELRKATSAHATVAAVGADRVARLADLMLAGSVTVGGRELPLAALNSPAVPADGVAVFTPLWGDASRTLVDGSGAVAEVIVDNGSVTAVGTTVTASPVPAGGLVLIARGRAADQLAGARIGDRVSVDFAARTDAPEKLIMALGSGSVLVRGGTAVDFPPSTGNDEAKPRTAIGWTDGGRRVLLVAVDGSANFSTGLSFDATAALLVRLGATEAFMLDGGGSTDLVARHPGDHDVSVINTPSDGSERPIPNAVGLFGATGSGRPRGIDVRPQADRVAPGLTLRVQAAGYDEAYAPAELSDVAWSVLPSSLGEVRGSVLHAGRPGAGSLRARAGVARGEHELRVIGDLHRLGFSQAAVTVEPGASVSIMITGADADGFSAPVDARDVTLDHDTSVITVEVADDGSVTITGRQVTPGSTTTLTASVAGISARLPVAVGLTERPLATFDQGERWTALAARGTASVSFVDAADRPGSGNGALQLSYDFTGQPSTSAAYAVAGSPITLPSGTQRLALWVKGDGKGHWLRAMMSSQGTTNVPFTFAQVIDWTGWRRVVGDLPTGFSEPITLSRVYIAETSQNNKNAGTLLFDELTALVGQQPSDREPPQPDPAVLEQQSGVDHGRWSFAVLSDLHVSAGAGLDSFSGRQAATALDQVAAARPDFVLINGDFVDDDNAASFALAEQLLHDHLPAGLPVYWGPGNHEAGLTATGGLDAFVAATGRPTHQVFDHRGTRFVMLDSHTADLRTADWDQIPLLRSELDKAAADDGVRSVVVSFHHPLADPTGAGASQLSDQLEAGLIGDWLADFRERSGKPVALFTGHAHVASVQRSDGVLEITTPAVGKTPYASPDQGGFFGWMLVGVDPDPADIVAGRPSPQTRDWLEADVRPVIDGIDLDVPAALKVGAAAAVGATGRTSGFGLTFPLRYSATVVWSGSAGLAIARTADEATAAATPRGTVAVLDLSTQRLTGVRAGTVTITVTSGGLSRSATVTVG